MNLAVPLADLPILIFQIAEQAQRGEETCSGSHSMAQGGLGQESRSPNSDGIVQYFPFGAEFAVRSCGLRVVRCLRGLVSLVYPFTLSSIYIF